jgi:2-amino-4-hydroxy-6-hydroxymethyldihydropteridine diphosphokinase
MKVRDVFISIGSNIGDRQYTIEQVVEEICLIPLTDVVKQSSIYNTSPVSDIAQKDFLNIVCHITTNLEVEELFCYFESIEKKYGKDKKPQNFPRTIDIDILFLDDIYYTSKKLTIPHPLWMERLFVLLPLSEITQTIRLKSCYGEAETIHLQSFLKNNFNNPNNETVIKLEH